VGDGKKLRRKLEGHLERNRIDYLYKPSGNQRAFITFTSWILTMDTTMAGLDIVVLSSLNEGTPVSIIEAQAAGKPVLSTNVGAVEEVMINNVSGLLSAPGDLDEFTSKL